MNFAPTLTKVGLIKTQIVLSLCIGNVGLSKYCQNSTNWIMTFAGLEDDDDDDEDLDLDGDGEKVWTLLVENFKVFCPFNLYSSNYHVLLLSPNFS